MIPRRHGWMFRCLTPLGGAALICLGCARPAPERPPPAAPDQRLGEKDSPEEEPEALPEGDEPVTAPPPGYGHKVVRDQEAKKPRPATE